MQYFNAVCAPLKHSEYLYLQGMNGDQLTICAAARSNQNGQSIIIRELNCVGRAPQAFQFVGTVWYSMQLNVSVALQYFNEVRATLKRSEYVQGMSGDQLTICAIARSNQNC